MIPADAGREQILTGQRHIYSAEVVSVVRQAEAILIFGPDGAKGELKKRFVSDRHGAHIEPVESEDAMPDRQIAVKVREYFSLEGGLIK